MDVYLLNKVEWLTSSEKKKKVGLQSLYVGEGTMSQTKGWFYTFNA